MDFNFESGFEPVGLFFQPSSSFFDEMSSFVADKKCLEVFAGNGYLASQLALRGADIKATSILSEMDGHHINQCFPVENMDCVDAVHRYGSQYDVLIISWPTVTPRALMALNEWGKTKPVIFIGEWTDLNDGIFGLGGCATDEFFESFEIEGAFNSYKPRNCLERAVYGYSKTSENLMEDILCDDTIPMFGLTELGSCGLVW